MPRFMGFVRMEEGVGTPPQALFEAMENEGALQFLANGTGDEHERDEADD